MLEVLGWTTASLLALSALIVSVLIAVTYRSHSRQEKKARQALSLLWDAERKAEMHLFRQETWEGWPTTSFEPLIRLYWEKERLHSPPDLLLQLAEARAILMPVPLAIVERVAQDVWLSQVAIQELEIRAHLAQDPITDLLTLLEAFDRPRGH